RNGTLSEPNDGEAIVDTPEDICIKEVANPIQAIVDFTFHDLINSLETPGYLQGKVVLALTNEVVDIINDKLLENMPGDKVEYFSFDFLCESEPTSTINQAVFSPQNLNSMKFSGLVRYTLDNINFMGKKHNMVSSRLIKGANEADMDPVLEFPPSIKIQAVLTGADLYLNKLAPSVGPNIFSTKEADSGFGRGGGPEDTDDREETPPPLKKEKIECHVSALKSLVKSHNWKNKGDPIRLDFEMVDTEVQGHTVVKGKEVMDEDLRKPFKEARRTPFNRRIMEFAGPEYKMSNNIKLYDGTTDPEDHLSRFAGVANSGEWPMPMLCRMFQQTLDGSARGWFERLPHDSINEWAELREAFATRFSVRRACFKEPYEITKIIRKANESLTAFKERWTVETGFIMGVPEVMKISSFMDSVKSPELAKRFSDKVPTTVNEMMERLDDFVRSDEAYANTELPKGETGESHRKISLPFNERDTRPFRNACPLESRRDEFINSYRGRDAYRTSRTRDDRAPYPSLRGEYNRRVTPVLTLNSLTKHSKEILATETQLCLPVPRPTLNPLKSGNTDRYCDYHQEKGHYTNDCIQLRKQLEMALESGKLNHLVKDVRQRGRGSRSQDNPQQAKIINVISVNSVKDKKRKVREATESWMNIPISFPVLSYEDISEEPLIVKAEVEGYLVKRVYVDEGSSVEVMFEHCFENLNPKIKGRLKQTQTDLVGFAEEVSKLLGKIELEVCFEDQKKKQMIEEDGLEGKGEMAVTEEVLVNPSFPDQLVTVGGRLSEAGKDQLKCLLQDNMGVFVWEPSDMTGVPRRTIEHALDVNPSLDPVCQKRRTFSMEKSGEVTNEVVEWVKAGIVCPVKYLTYISNPVLVKKGDGTWRMCIDFKNLNSACPKDYYPLSNIDCKVESVMRFKYKCFLDAYKGYHQIQMVKEDEEKTAFYTDQGTDEKILLADIAETFDNLKKINMKLNPKKCSFGVEEGKFLGYMVTSEGIRANPKKTRDLADLQSPRTLKEMQSLNGKLASLR
ncbi:reverse transcriptase domain-containing protein, partial [Tanacetum coccineum]